MKRYRDIELILDTYSFNEVLEYNDLTEADVLVYLVENKYLNLPEPLPLDFDND